MIKVVRSGDTSPESKVQLRIKPDTADDKDYANQTMTEPLIIVFKPGKKVIFIK